MTRVEVLAPLRIETRFVAADGGDWTLHVRVYPDDFSLARSPAPPKKEELDLLEDAFASPDPDTPDHSAALDAAFRSIASALGGRRAWWLWLTATKPSTTPDGAPWREVDRSGEAARSTVANTPIGLPDALDVWLVLDSGNRLAATLALHLDEIAADLTMASLLPEGRELPKVWWLDYECATRVGLATSFRLTASEVDDLRALVVVGAGETPALELLEAHSAAGRAAVITQGTPTNTVAGAEAAALADDPETWLTLLDRSAADQEGTSAVLAAFGADPALATQAAALPGGDLQHGRAARLAVQGLWPVLWGRTIRDIVGTIAGTTVETDLAEWASEALAVQGPWPAIRIGDQPYGLIPTSDFGTADLPTPGDLDLRWRDDPGDDPVTAALEQSIVTWAVPWRDGSARATAAATTVPNASPVVGADAGTLLGIHGRHAPSAFWRVRRVNDLPIVQAQQIAQGLPLSHETPYDRGTATAWHDNPFSFAPITADGARRHLPGPTRDEEVDLDLLEQMLWKQPEALYYGEGRKLGLFGHLLCESVIIARATVGRARLDINAGITPDPGRSIPLDADFPNAVMHGSDDDAGVVAGSGTEGEIIVHRFEAVRKALAQLIEEYAQDPASTLRAIKAALDAASFRVDPWLLGMASRRAGRHARTGTPFLLGAYGWVDRPQPWTPGKPGKPPGPTDAGLVHAPSYAQAQVAAILRDAALRTTEDARWDITLTSDRVRAAVALGERVRLGVHPFEALGLEVESIVGDPDDIRTLRRAFPTTAETADDEDATRRVCDGVAVLQAVREGGLPVDVPAELASRLAPLEQVLDTYADLLLVDGVHALVTRSPEAGGAAMEAAAGLSIPPELRGIRTPREATTVSVTCWLALPPGPASGDPAARPAVVADPVFSALVDGSVDNAADPAVVRTTRLVGGTDAPDSMTDHPALIPTMAEDLQKRRAELLTRMAAHVATLKDAAVDVTDADLDTLDREWRLGLHAETEEWMTDDRRVEATAAFEARIAAAGKDSPVAVAALQEQLRALVGRPHLPVIPVVSRSALLDWTEVPHGRLDAEWLEIVAAVHPRVAPLEAHQLTAETPWPSAIMAPGDDPWARTGPVHIAYGPEVVEGSPSVGLVLLDRWVDSVPSRHHVTQAAFGFNAPKTRAPNAVLIAVPPDPDRPLEDETLLEVVLQTRRLALARSARPSDREGLPWATPAPIVQAESPVDIRKGWPE